MVVSRSRFFFDGILLIYEMNRESIGFIDGIRSIFLYGNGKGQSAFFAGFQNFITAKNRRVYSQGIRFFAENQMAKPS